MAKFINDIFAVLPAVDWSLYQGSDIAISTITLDSRQAKSGSLFFAMQGEKFQASDFIHAAIDSGAVAICCDNKFITEIQPILTKEVALIGVKNLSKKISLIADSFFDQPTEKMQVVAITGTDGKTSVSHFIAQTFHQAAVVGTMGNGKIEQLQQATHTTPDAISLQALFNGFIQQGIKTVAMEASSHGLSQHRLDAVHINTAVLTNFSRDHLDYHGSLAAYKQAKKRLFSELPIKNMVVNLNDEFGKELYEEFADSRPILAYQLGGDKPKKEILFAEIKQIQPTGFILAIDYQNQLHDIQLNLLGKFNVENALAVLSVLLINNEPFDNACKKVSALKPVNGRMQLIDTHEQGAIVIDYAHTPQALAAAIHAVRIHHQGKLICVFGCGGERDRGKRPLMAQAAMQASYVFLTNDNPRDEDQTAIIDDICAGFDGFDDYEVEYDRAIAIHKAITKAGSEDVVLIAGKGHENYQIIGDEKIQHNDAEVVKQYLRDAA